MDSAPAKKMDLPSSSSNDIDSGSEEFQFESPSFIVQSPTTTMSQEESPYPFPTLVRSPPSTYDSTTSSSLQQQSQQHLSSHSTFNSSSSLGDDLDSVTTALTSLETTGDSTCTSTEANASTGGRAGSYRHGRNLSADISSASRNGSRSASRNASRRSSVQFTKPIEVKETLDAIVTETADGHLQLKQYVLKKIIGQGAYGIVNLGVDVNTGVEYAIKEFSKSKLRKRDRANLFRLGSRGRGRGRGPRGPEAPGVTEASSPLDLIRGEIAILKKLNHINIVKLYEVLDVAAEDSMFMVFELCQRGVLTEVSLGDKTGEIFTDTECRDVFQQMVLGIEYLHEHDIIHRDIKPDNLLRSEDGTLKIVDFGVSEIFKKKGHDLTKKSAGSPAFMAPELCHYGHGEVSGKATDVWSMGVTLYCIRYGKLPFRSANIIELNQSIREDMPDMEGENDKRFLNVMTRLLEKDPAKRITIDELRNDPWLTDDGREELISKEENIRNCVTEVTEEDLRGAVQSISGLITVFKAISKFKRLLKSPASSRSSSRDRHERAEEEDSPVLALSSMSSSSTSSPKLVSDKFQDADEIVVPILPLYNEGSTGLVSRVEHMRLEDEKVDDSQSSLNEQKATVIVSTNSASGTTSTAAVATASEKSSHEQDSGRSGYQGDEEDEAVERFSSVCYMKEDFSYHPTEKNEQEQDLKSKGQE
ncbi:hypothetical protein BGZ51_007327 [Haplosporangium sp. Z 767]|nr:hypothetical protein BGZ51_007327 [Haplosporangium sp. Z 767]KAF9179000.1 hypothetical protein BGZ50_007310 [Haplosporangium sp. Z 11]